jgi:competence protein ComEC
LTPALEGQDLLVSGRIHSLPQVDADGLRFVFVPDQVQWPDGRPGPRLPARLWLAWPRREVDEVLLAAPTAPLRAGERWRLPLRLKRPHGVLNPHGFDAELWLFEQGIGGVGAVRAAAAQDPVWLEAGRWWAGRDQLERLRQALRDRLLLCGGALPEVGVLSALAVGDQSAIDGNSWDMFRQTGVAHLVSISGLHITLFAWLAAGGVGWAWRRVARCRDGLPAVTAGRWGGVLLATLYALLAGWGVPAQRTVGMLLVAVAFRHAGRAWPPLLIGAVVAALIAAWDPWALLQPGFWLSFVAVMLLMVSDPGPAAAQPLPGTRPDRPGLAGRLGLALQQGLRTQWVATLGLAPLSLLMFQQLSLVGLLANLLAVPLVSFVILPLSLLGLIWTPLLGAAGLATTALLAWLGCLAHWPGAVLTVPVAPPWAQAAALLAGALLVLPLTWRWRALAFPLSLPLLWPAVPRPAQGQFDLLAFDVGQGSAVLVRTQHHALLHDTGPQWGQDSDAGRRVILPVLQALGQRSLDELVLSHSDADHVGGAAAVLAGLPVARWRTTLEDRHPLRQRSQPVHIDCAAGQTWTWDGVLFEVLHPAPGAPRLGVKPNTLSCTLRVVGADGRSVLLTGDLEAEQERALVARLGPALRSTVLLAPHHGSKTSSTPEFLAAVQPEVVVIQVAYRSRFGHPHPSVLARYLSSVPTVLRTDYCGAWRWGPDGNACIREQDARYWHWKPTVSLH